MGHLPPNTKWVTLHAIHPCIHSILSEPLTHSGPPSGTAIWDHWRQKPMEVTGRNRSLPSRCFMVTSSLAGHFRHAGSWYFVMPVQEVSVGGRDERTEVTHFCASGLILECLTSGRLLFSLSSGHLGHAARCGHVTARAITGWVTPEHYMYM